jgi:hypothetical protein
MPDKPSLSTEQDSISIVIPFFNEGPNVAALLSEVRAMAEAMHTTYEVLAIVSQG